jgi:hypothetical protein
MKQTKMIGMENKWYQIEIKGESKKKMIIIITLSNVLGKKNYKTIVKKMLLFFLFL